YAFKVDGIASKTVRGNFTFYENARTETGLGVGPLRAAEAAWIQSDPSRYFKGEGHFLLGPKLFASARGAYLTESLTLTPVGGLPLNPYIDDSGVVHNTTYGYVTTRPQRYGAGEATYLAGRHALALGFSYRQTPVERATTYPGSHIQTIWNGYPNLLAQVTRDTSDSTDARYVNGFVDDTVSLD